MIKRHQRLYESVILKTEQCDTVIRKLHSLHEGRVQPSISRWVRTTGARDFKIDRKEAKELQKAELENKKRKAAKKRASAKKQPRRKSSHTVAGGSSDDEEEEEDEEVQGSYDEDNEDEEGYD
jgi:hypothetical protein